METKQCLSIHVIMLFKQLQVGIAVANRHVCPTYDAYSVPRLRMGVSEEK